MPIRVDVEVDGQRYRDAFTWNPRGTRPPLLASFISSSRRVSRFLPGLTRLLLAACRQIPTRRSLASPSGRPRTSSCRPISFPRCSSPSRCLSFRFFGCPVLSYPARCSALLMVHRLYCFSCRGNLRSSAPTRGRRCKSRRRLCLSRFVLLFWLIFAHQQAVSGPVVFLSSDEWGLCP